MDNLEIWNRTKKAGQSSHSTTKRKSFILETLSIASLVHTCGHLPGFGIKEEITTMTATGSDKD